MREQLIKQMTDYVINVLEEKRPEFSGFAVCPFVKRDRINNEMFFDIINNSEIDVDITTRQDGGFLRAINNFKNSNKRSGLFALIGEEIGEEETKGFQKFLNIVLEETNNGDVAVLCFNPKDKLEIEGYNPRSSAPFFLVNVAYRSHLSKSHGALKKTNYYDKMPATYKKYLNIK